MKKRRNVLKKSKKLLGQTRSYFRKVDAIRKSKDLFYFTLFFWGIFF